MAQNHSFRTAFNGFNREDVVRYIEYLNSRHHTAVNQFQTQIQALQEELNALREEADKPDLTQQVADLAALCHQQEQALAQAQEQVTALQEQLAEVTAQRDAAVAEKEQQDLAGRELEAYRRAERMERAARERADRLCRQATAAIAEATTQVDNAAQQFRVIADRVNAQVAELQGVVDESKSALMSAAATMYTIRPQEEER